MRKSKFFWLCLIWSGLVSAKDYYEDFAKEYEKKLYEMDRANNKPLTHEEVIKTWETAWSNFRPGYAPILNKNGRLLDWVSPEKAATYSRH